MRKDLPLCKFENCKYYSNGNCVNQDKCISCEYRLVKNNTIQKFVDNLKYKSQLVAPSVYSIPYRAVAVDDIDKVAMYMTQ